MLTLRLREATGKPTDGNQTDAPPEADRETQEKSFPGRSGTPLPAASFVQERMWLLEQLTGEAAVYNIGLLYRLHGPLDTGALEAALSEIVRRHESLRTTFGMHDGQLVQFVRPAAALTLPRTDLRSEPAPSQLSEARHLAREEAQARFDLANDVMLRPRLYHLAADDHVLLLNLHHIAFDAWSHLVFWRELAELYGAFRSRRSSTLPPKTAQYREFARRQRERLQGETLQRLLDYWRKRLDGASSLQLPTDRPRPARQSFAGATLRFSFPAALMTGLKQLAQREGATLFMALIAGLNAVLHRYSGQEDIVIGTGIAGRSGRELESMIGCFVNTLALRTDLGGQPGFRQLLGRVRDTTLAALDHDQLPFEKLVAELDRPRELDRHALFQVALALHNTPAPDTRLAGLEVEPLPMDGERSRFDLTFIVEDRAGTLEGSLEYSTALFEAATMRRLLTHLATLLTGAVDRPDCAIAQLPMLAEDERRQLLATWNDTRVERARDVCLHHLLEAQAARTPDAAAVVCEDRRLTYRELDGRANQLAHHLRRHGVGPESLVAVCFDRSLEMIIALFGVLKAGGAYVPLDPSYPGERLRFMVEDAGVRIVLTTGRLQPVLPPMRAALVLLDVEHERIALESSAKPAEHAHEANAAYVIYTSGSTGRPKGVCIEHRNIVNYVLGVAERIGFSPGMAHATVSTIAADLGNTAVFGALATGGCLHVISQERAMNGAALAEYLTRRAIDVLKIVPSHLIALQSSEAAARLFPRQHLILGGEASRTDWIERMRACSPPCAIHNHYGPTETTVGVLMHRADSPRQAPPSGTLPLGRPLPNVRAYILDAQLQPVPAGIPGELCIGGAGVARGYLNRAEATAEPFIPDPFAHEPGARMYRTGDRARHLSDGSIEFLGRTDDQVKIRGFRIEPQEIEATLREHPGVRAAVARARARAEDAHELQLVAYVVPRDPRQAILAGRPVHMLPNGLRVAHLNRNETDYIYREVFVLQAYLRHGITIRDGTCIVDAGANIGLFTVFASQMARDLRILAFEPNPTVFELLAANARAHGMNVKCFPCGLSDQDKAAEMTFFTGFSLLSGFYANAATERAVVKKFALNQSTSVADRASDGELAAELDLLLDERFQARKVETRLRSLSSVIDEHDLEQIDLLKINAEKSELDILRGLTPAHWRRIRQLVIEVDLGHQVEPIVSLLERHGYEALVEQDPLLRDTDLCYVYAIRPSAAGRLARNAAPQTSAHPPPPPTDNDWITSDLLREHARQRLPEHMVPSAFVILPTLPLTANGKVDFRALRDVDSNDQGGAVRSFVAPQTETERKIAASWQELLQVDRVGRQDNFFELGGHSLLAIRAISQLRRMFAVEVPLQTLFEAKTVAQLASEIERRQTVASGPPRATTAERAADSTEELVL